MLTPPFGRDIVLTYDLLAQGVHFLGDEPPGDIARKLVAVNLSDLAAMGARPVGVLLGLALTGAEDDAWLAAFTAGLAQACARWSAPLLGGDTVRGVATLTLGLTALGAVLPGAALGRARAQPGDHLYVTGNIGDASLGLAVARGGYLNLAPEARAALLARYRGPEPRLAFGAALAGHATACMDVSDGLLIDAERLAAASGIQLVVRLAALPVSRIAEAVRADALALATGGDDYELLFTAPSVAADALITLARRHALRLTRIGAAELGAGLAVLGIDGAPISPVSLGYEH